MKKISLTLILLFVSFTGSYFLVDDRKAEAANPAKASCQSCHADFTKVLPKEHPPVTENDLSACTSCHTPELAGKAVKNAFSRRMHLAHILPRGKQDCTACHIWVPGKSFGIKGVKGSLGTPSKEDVAMMQEIFASWGGIKLHG
jgi:nitrate/TMAO reductase-like tetraheme cytochrome c subunit